MLSAAGVGCLLAGVLLSAGMPAGRAADAVLVLAVLVALALVVTGGRAESRWSRSAVPARPRRSARALPCAGLLLSPSSGAEPGSTSGQRRHRSLDGRALVSLGLLPVLTSCLSTGEPDRQLPAQPPPAAFTQRAAVPSCGTFELDATEDPPSDAIACLAEATADRAGSDLTLSRPDTEGFPLVSHIRVLPGTGTVELFTDHSRSPFSGGVGWSRATCDTFDVITMQGTECVHLKTWQVG